MTKIGHGTTGFPISQGTLQLHLSDKRRQECKHKTIALLVGPFELFYMSRLATSEVVHNVFASLIRKNCHRVGLVVASWLDSFSGRGTSRI